MVTTVIVASIQIRFDDSKDSRQVTTRKLPDLPAELTGSAYWKAHRKSKRNSYILKLQEEDSDRGQPVSYELPVEYINYCWYGLNWNKALKQYFTNPKELLPKGYGGLQRGEPPANEPRPSTIPPPIQPLGEPLQAGMTFSKGIHSLLQGTISNPASLSSPITSQPPPIIQPISVIPIQVQTTTMSTQPATVQATITTLIDDKTNLRGKQPPTFDGTRSKANNFWRAFKIYQILNKETNTIKNPFHRTALAISFIAEPNVNDWAELLRFLSLHAYHTTADSYRTYGLLTHYAYPFSEELLDCHAPFCMNTYQAVTHSVVLDWCSRFCFAYVDSLSCI